MILSFISTVITLETETTEAKGLLFDFPYDDGGGGCSDWGQGVALHDARYMISPKKGEIGTYSYVDVTGPYGRAQAGSEAWLIGPKGGKFSVDTTRAYLIRGFFDLNGAAWTVFSGMVPGDIPSGLAQVYESYIDLELSIYEYGTNYHVETKTTNLYTPKWPGGNYLSWHNQWRTVSFYANLCKNRQYYFKVQLRSAHSACALGVGFAYSYSSIVADLHYVTIT